MDAFPLSNNDWQRVEDAATALTNATLADDDVLCASHLVDLQEVLEDLRSRYGDHPIIHETEADYLNDPTLRLKGYRAAIRLAEQHALVTSPGYFWFHTIGWTRTAARHVRKTMRGSGRA